MKFQIKLWMFIIIINIFDIDPSDRNLKCGITIEW